ncbi:hypothetical protein DPU24_27455 [Salmonella enterica subsp. enterica serovar Oranienburg]|nr:hypothetical protein [Salmonella enterica subsp. enterica serovar Oranienburg]EDQ3854050.1 hypothetical protein [Salmonella enterica subsp. diarizonae]EHI3193155.1 hypothetical protein [Salmonella enterica]
MNHAMLQKKRESYTQEEEDAFRALLNPEQRIEVIKIMLSVVDKGLKNSRANKRIELEEYIKRVLGKMEGLAKLDREKRNWR